MGSISVPRIAVCTSHPVQYYAPIFAELARRAEVEVFYGHKATQVDQARAGFGKAFDWDIDLTSGYPNQFLRNVSQNPGTHHFWGVDTPEIGHRLSQGKFDAVLIFGWHLKSSIQALFAARRLGLPTIVRGDSHLDTRRSPIKRFAKDLGYPLFLRMYSAACYVGLKSKEYYLHYGFPENALFRAPHCVDTKFFHDRSTPEAGAQVRLSLGVPEGQELVLFAGKLVPSKRPLDVVEAVAFSRAEGRNVGMLVCGAGAFQNAVKAFAAERGVPLYDLGFRNQTQMPSAYGAADVLMLPSSETWGLVCNEAIACGCPILVSSSVGCGPDLVGNGTGAVYPFADGVAAGGALTQMLRSPCSQMVLQAKSQEFTIAAAAAGVLEAVDYVSARKSL